MIIQTLGIVKNKIEVVKLEIACVGGLPQVHVLGQSDRQTRDCGKRIKAALRSSGFEFPSTRQVLVNVADHFVSKIPLGWDLAIALGILIETKQIPHLPEIQNVLIVGELGLSGEVQIPKLLKYTKPSLPSDIKLIIGAGPSPILHDTAELPHLRDLPQFWTHPEWKKKPLRLRRPQRPEPRVKWIHPEFADLLVLASISRGHTLIVGPAGTGKTTFAELLNVVSPTPSAEEMGDIELFEGDSERIWRPFRMPHSSTTLVGLVGGGDPIEIGEVSRAHLGHLVLDEFLVFRGALHEALRGPLEKRVIHLSRGHDAVSLPANFQLIATTNLCPCGDYVPGQRTHCRYTMNKCRSHLNRLSGPLLDRFDLLISTSAKWLPPVPIERFAQIEPVRSVKYQTIETVVQRVEHGYEWLQKNFSEDGEGDWEARILGSMNRTGLNCIRQMNLLSQRRLQALLRVSRAVAAMDQKVQITHHHVNQAEKWAIIPFNRFKRGIGA